MVIWGLSNIKFMKDILELRVARYGDSKQGILSVFQLKTLPITVKRIFTVSSNGNKPVRGLHAHKKCNQLIVCVSWKLELICDDGVKRVGKKLNSKSSAYLIPKGIWAEQIYTKGEMTVIMVLCDRDFEEHDYIRDYDEFIKWRLKNKWKL